MPLARSRTAAHRGNVPVTLGVCQSPTGCLKCARLGRAVIDTAHRHKRDKNACPDAWTSTLVPLSHVPYARVNLAAFALLVRLADGASGSGAASARLLLENNVPCFHNPLLRSRPPYTCSCPAAGMLRW